jgi:hypothetical protein
MALNKTTLQSDLEDWMNGKDGYNSISDSMNVFINSYETYAMEAQDISGDNPATLNKAAALSILNTTTLSATATSAAQVFEDAIIAFWTGGSFATATPPPGTIPPEISAAVTGPPTPGSLKSAILAVFNDLQKGLPVKFIEAVGTAVIVT